jgi:glutathione S-transferase
MGYKLYYFDIYGRAEGIRMLLTHAKAEFEDVRVNGESLAELKAAGKLEFGQVPMLEHDGRHLVQSWSILRYLGKIHGYYPETSEEAWACDSVVDAVEDYLGKYFKANFEKDEERKKTLIGDFLAWLPGWVAAIQNRIAANSDPHFVVGNKRTIADFALAMVAFDLINNEANPHHADTAPLTKKEDYPVLTTYLTKLHEELKDYLTARP